MNTGIIYITYGNIYTNLAIKSIQSLRQHSKLPIIVYQINAYNRENEFNELGCLCLVVPMLNVQPARACHLAKYTAFRTTPFDKFLYLDADTIINEDITYLFNKTQNNNIVGVNDKQEISELSAKFTQKTLMDNLGINYHVANKYPPLLNCGVLCMTGNVARKLGRSIPIIKEDIHKSLVLNAAIIKSDVTVILVSDKYNGRLANNPIWHIKRDNHDELLQTT